MKCIFILLALTCVALSSSIEDETLTEFVLGNLAFSARVYKEIAQFELGNVIVSPIAAQTILSMAHEGARGATSKELAAGLHLPNAPQKIQYAFRHFLPNLMKHEDHLKIYRANKMYLADYIKIEPNFKNIAESIYHSGAEHVDFSLSIDAAKTINDWVAGNTINKIRHIVSAGDYDDETKMVLVNALYFRGEWVRQFDREKTGKHSFYQSDGDSIEVDTMSQVGEFYYYDDPVAKAEYLELPYRGGDIKMVIILPHRDQHISNVELLTERLLQAHEFKKEKVSVHLPKFKCIGETKFVPILQNMGIEKAFRSGADFSGISNKDELIISDVVQKSHISFNEAGTETAVSLLEPSSTPSDPTPPIVFKANRPFMYYISYEGIITFIGRLSQFDLKAL